MYMIYDVLWHCRSTLKERGVGENSRQLIQKLHVFAVLWRSVHTTKLWGCREIPDIFSPENGDRFQTMVIFHSKLLVYQRVHLEGFFLWNDSFQLLWYFMVPFETTHDQHPGLLNEAATLFNDV